MTLTSHVKNQPYSKLFAAFFSGLLVATAGLYTGQYVPPALFLPLVVVEIIMLIAMVFARKRKAIGYLLMYAFMAISGLTLYPAISTYISILGATVVLQAFAVTTAAFGGIAIFAMVSKRDFTFLGNFLFISVIALIALGIMNIFLPFSSTTSLVISGFGILVFVGYTLYDFSRLTLYGFSDQDIPRIVVSVYLDFVNLFLYILQFMGILSRND
ncbi:BAX inhibitor (BI)-1/YccA family protein [Terrilactibacillus sp. BCM23-1]|uniref:BAX inhibitor (BI)-1/YccA family protein n=1 Tax=Terrilactibacillus tamarindi TaxID=2599694 RepID=A0A6N8CSR3_9BACI|nr:Bax inhibitor-1/YccA family protein [Terrilactibacillus tamarindi]MTT31036.1 BAX inhibitor (BI)-1/YccA family protein [Terrilactibacillus tamarindi]